MLVQSHYDSVKGQWEERFEQRYGRWRAVADKTVEAYVECGILEHGFVRLHCDRCKADCLLPFSCKARGLCPSCGAKRAAAFAAFLRDEVLEDVPHVQWVFSLPKMLRPYFLHHRELLGRLCRAAYESVRELMVEAASDPTVRPGFVAVIQTFGDKLNWNPHVHCLASRGGWSDEGRFVALPHIDARAAELLFRHKVLKFLRQADLLDESRLALLLSWNHHTGFSAHNETTVDPDDPEGLARLARYLLRSPLSLERLTLDERSGAIHYAPKPGHDRDDPDTEPLGSRSEPCDPGDFLARLLLHIPAPKLHLIHYFGPLLGRLQGSPPHQLSRHPKQFHGPSRLHLTPRGRACRLPTDPLGRSAQTALGKPHPAHLQDRPTSVSQMPLAAAHRGFHHRPSHRPQDPPAPGAALLGHSTRTARPRRFPLLKTN